VTEREEQVERTRIARHASPRERPRAIEGAAEGAFAVVREDARCLEEHVGIEAPLAEQVRRGPRGLDQRGEQVASGRSFASPRSELVGELAKRSQSCGGVAGGAGSAMRSRDHADLRSTLSW
jgi:hypothetical protein